MHGVSQINICEDVAVVTLNNMPLELAPVSDVFSRLGQAGINIDMISQTSPPGNLVSISFTCLDSDLRGVLDVVKPLSQSHPGVSSMVSSGNVKIQLLGQEMREQPGVFARALAALCGAGAPPPRMVTTSEMDISLLVSADCLPLAKTVLNQAFEL